ncbi:hypothetical protein LZS85_15695 [Aliivibrio fischeri]|uniref:hypothetical protein n=1 Tax=Aliivibrio fischeri TaxID=668 RepID=UPI001F1F8026|nr:hypothetical protein [Aliivibrio fischeri]MCE7567567.1 hypothetical protein [Aliivibrio fischeri]
MNNCHEVTTLKKAGLANHLKQFDLSISDLVEESGRSRDSLNKWWIRDKQMIAALIRATLTHKYTTKLMILDGQESKSNKV